MRLRHTRSGQLLCASPNTPTTAEADDCLAVSVLPEGELRGAAAVATSCWEVGRASGGHGGIALQAGEQLLLRGAACGLYLRASDGEASRGGAAQRWTLMRYAAAAPARAPRADDRAVVEPRRGGGEGGGGDDAPRCLAAGVAPSEPVLALEAAEVHAPPATAAAAWAAAGALEAASAAVAGVLPHAGAAWQLVPDRAAGASAAAAVGRGRRCRLVHLLSGTSLGEAATLDPRAAATAERQPALCAAGALGCAVSFSTGAADDAGGDDDTTATTRRRWWRAADG